MDCLAEGRGISLPALSVAAAKGVATAVGAYARIRKQFKVHNNCILYVHVQYILYVYVLIMFNECTVCYI